MHDPQRHGDRAVGLLWAIVDGGGDGGTLRLEAEGIFADALMSYEQGSLIGVWGPVGPWRWNSAEWCLDIAEISEVQWSDMVSVPPREDFPEMPEQKLTPYTEAALDKACRNLAAATYQERGLAVRREFTAMGRLVAGMGLPEDLAFPALLHAASEIEGFDKDRDIRVARDWFDVGKANPRSAQP